MAHSHYHRLRKPGTLEDLRVKVWRAVVAAEDTLERAMQEDKDAAKRAPDYVDRVSRAIHAAVSVYREYRALLVDSEIEARLATLEDQAERHMQSIAIRN